MQEHKYKEKSNKNQQNASRVQTNHIDACFLFNVLTIDPVLTLAGKLGLFFYWQKILSNKNGKWYGGGVVQTRSICIDRVHLFLSYFFLWTSLRCVQVYKSSRKWIENLGMEQGYLHCLVLSCFLSLSWISHPRNHALLTKTKFHQSMKSSFESSSTWEGTCFCWIICLSHYALGRLD